MKHTLKRNATLAILSALFLFGAVIPPVTNAKPVSITIYIGNGIFECTGFGLCKIEWNWNIAAGGQSSGNYLTGTASLEGDVITVNIEKPANEAFKSLPVDKDIVLNPDDAKQLGFKNVRILKGNYELDFASNKLGTISFKVKADGKLKVRESPTKRSSTGE